MTVTPFFFFFFFFNRPSKEFTLALIARQKTRAQHFSLRSVERGPLHFRGRWKSFSPLGQQPGLRTDSFSAPSPTITPTPTTEAPPPPPPPPPTFSHFNIDPHPKRKKGIASFQHTLRPYLSVYRTLSARFLCQTPPASPPLFFSFCLLYCNHFAGPETCGCAGSRTKKRERQGEREVTWELS